MKGLIFVELMRFVELQMGAEGQEDVIADANLPNDAAFTNVGNYPSDHAAKLVAAASKRSGIPEADLCQAFGRYLYQRFEILFPDLMARYRTAHDLLDHVEAHIHEEVRAIYPDADPPRVTTHEDGDCFYVTYKSHRPFAHIAFGLIEQCIETLDQGSNIAWCEGSTPSNATFALTKTEEIKAA